MVVTLIVEASVVVKCLLNDPVRHVETAQTARLMRWMTEGREPVVLPID